MNYGYIRVSTDEQNLGIEAQKEAILHGAPDAKFHIDQLSGATPINKRPGLMNLIGNLTKGDKVFVLRRDRLARDVVIAGMICRMIQKKGAELFSTDGIGNGDGPESDLIASVVDAVAQYERAMISLRTAAAMAIKRKNMEYCGGNTPYGYVVIDDMLVEDTEQQDVIADLLDYRDAGMSPSQIAAVLNANEVEAPNGKRWYGNTIRRILIRAGGEELD